MTQQERLQEALGYVDPALVEAADCPRRRRPLRLGRLALAAACLCAGLLGTVWAGGLSGGFRLVGFFGGLRLVDGEECVYDGYTLWGGVAFAALEDLPQEVLDTAKAHPASTVAVDVHSWSEAEEYFALDLPENEYLDGLIPSGFRSQLSSDQAGPTLLECQASYRSRQTPGLRVKVRMMAYTERMYRPDDELSISALFPEGTEFTTQGYTAASGLEALVTTVELPSDDPRGSRMVRADFALSGVWYQVEASSRIEPDQALEAVEAVLEGFER